MSRIGKNPVQIPDKVEVTVSDSQNGQTVKVKGPKGELESTFRKEINIKKEDGKIVLKRANNEIFVKCLHGTTRTMLQNMVLGVTQGFKKELDIVGVGYRAQVQSNKLVMQIGYSHQIEIEAPKDTKIEVDKNQTHITVSGVSKQAVGDLASKIRDVRLPEPYKGKGIKYSDERIRRKAGKTAVKK